VAREWIARVRWDRPSGRSPPRAAGQCRIPIIPSHPEHPFQAPKTLAAKGVREAKKKRSETVQGS